MQHRQEGSCKDGGACDDAAENAAKRNAEGAREDAGGGKDTRTGNLPAAEADAKARVAK